MLFSYVNHGKQIDGSDEHVYAPLWLAQLQLQSMISTAWACEPCLCASHIRISLLLTDIAQLTCMSPANRHQLSGCYEVKSIVRYRWHNSLVMRRYGTMYRLQLTVFMFILMLLSSNQYYSSCDISGTCPVHKLYLNLSTYRKQWLLIKQNNNNKLYWLK